MDAKHRAVQILAALLLVVTVAYTFYVLMGFIPASPADIWLLLTHLLNIAVCAYFVWLSVRMMRWAKSLPSLQTGGVKWGRVLLGVLFAFYALKTQLHPPASAANLDQPMNKIQGQANVAIYIAVMILGIVLAISGVHPKYRRSAQPEDVLQKRPRVPWP